MPQMIEHIDAIARQVGRDVLYLTFFEDSAGVAVREHWTENASRKEVVAWLDANEYTWKKCGEIASDHWMVMGYRGTIYIDTAYDREDPVYLKLEHSLESPDGTLRLPKMRFWALSIGFAMCNAHQDAPGYWEKRAEDF
ncbi:hypothetical protein LMG23992_02257 [Cupriavidus laharis]|uniref:Uncharacterized protein n=1 Tax=Cupriavidus laharis TaxID=151654 RepID=A0ABM8WY71_9BURK|nr:hypothetical protein [Cupriavidus laharis]CAG9172520.1 hypothetical protein LMG23992_02257 [Cupriavidus laharis]